METVKENNKVSVHYTGTLENGEVFDTSREREPLAFTVGQGQMIPGFEEAVKGMKKEETKKVTLGPDDAYGEVKPDMVQKVDKAQLPDEIEPSVGQQLASQLPSGQQIVVTVTDVADEHITIDANHPLAGKELTFDIEVVDIAEGEPAEKEG
jgi:FKBP-type peptidyl-prolyl cis-trans isomerase 2